MKASQQDLKIFLLSSIVCVPVNIVWVQNTGIAGQVWEQLNDIARDSKKQESGEAILAGQYHVLCHHRAKAMISRFP